MNATLNQDENFFAINMIKNELFVEEHDEHLASVLIQNKVISKDESIMVRMLGKCIHEQEH